MRLDRLEEGSESLFLQELERQCISAKYPSIVELSFDIVSNPVRTETVTVNRAFILELIADRFELRAGDKVRFSARIILEGVEAFLKRSEDPSRISNFQAQLEAVIDAQIEVVRGGMVQYYWRKFSHSVLGLVQGRMV